MNTVIELLLILDFIALGTEEEPIIHAHLWIEHIKGMSG